MGRFTALGGVLARMLEAYGAFAAEEERRNAALVAADYAGAEATGRREREIADLLVALERERKAEADKLAADAGPDAAALPLRDLLARYADDPDAERVERLRRDLLAACDRVGELNRRNLALLQKSLDVVDHTLKTVRELALRENGDTYNRRGYDRTPEGAPVGLKLLDVKI